MIINFKTKFQYHKNLRVLLQENKLFPDVRRSMFSQAKIKCLNHIIGKGKKWKFMNNETRNPNLIPRKILLGHDRPNIGEIHPYDKI